MYCLELVISVPPCSGNDGVKVVSSVQLIASEPLRICALIEVDALVELNLVDGCFLGIEKVVRYSCRRQVRLSARIPITSPKSNRSGSAESGYSEKV